MHTQCYMDSCKSDMLQASSFTNLERNDLGVLIQGKLHNSFVGFVKEQGLSSLAGHGDLHLQLWKPPT